MSVTFHIYYSAKGRNARKFAKQMIKKGIADAIRAEEGNEQYEYFYPIHDKTTVLLIDSWRDQDALDAHHTSPMMKQISALREKYDVHMKIEKFEARQNGAIDEKYVRR